MIVTTQPISNIPPGAAEMTVIDDHVLRDLFAAFALGGLIANQGGPSTVGSPWLAAEAYQAADAMLAQRNASPTD